MDHLGLAELYPAIGPLNPDTIGSLITGPRAPGPGPRAQTPGLGPRPPAPGPGPCAGWALSPAGSQVYDRFVEVCPSPGTDRLRFHRFVEEIIGCTVTQLPMPD